MTEWVDTDLLAMAARGLRLGGGDPTTSAARLECHVRLLSTTADDEPDGGHRPAPVSLEDPEGGL